MQVMSSASPTPVTITLDGGGHVSGLLQTPPEARACFVLAHGAGAGMTHPFMIGIVDGLAERGFATLRYQFPYMENGSKRPDSPKVAQMVVRAAVAEASRLVPKLALLAGGKSFGGRMTSQAQAALPLSGVRGLVFLGFPLHPAGQVSEDRAEHLFSVQVPMLFLQGTRDQLADSEVIQKVVKRLGVRARVEILPDADHSFHVPARSGRTDSEVLTVMLNAMATWMQKVSRA